MRFLSVIALSVAGVLTSLPAFAFDAFQIQSIQFSGLDRVDRASIMDDVFLKPGDQLTLENSNQLIRRLYASGYFDNVQLFNHHGTLVIQVEERPAIAKVTIDGNKEIKTEMLQDVLRQSGLTVGNLFDPSVLRQVTQSLQQAYYEQGKYAV
ncbi:MAG: outer membrane protein assembly factor BamA, partial [Gammaproteobacteria bacterium]|nr:outer membrane protein assembly factor BamA [Gammaproteobacteria bacterium]